jgi:lipopolysaccharide transport system ATP-binding protein
MAIIEVKHLTKEYQLGKVISIKDTARNSLNRILGRPIYERERFKALDDVDFQVEEGEVVGIIGTNGAGKSTLLKHLAHITTPTKGEVIVRGSVAPLIEVGAGLNPELTGRENIFLNSAILGIPRKTIREKLDEIIEFSELEQFIDTPIKRYSSGMRVRLGFAIAVSLDEDILILDEVLAVGDLAFQRKCFDRMEEMIKRRRKTVLLVSHNIRQVERLCDRVILLDRGQILCDGFASEICRYFYERNDEKIRQAVASKSSVTNWQVRATNDVDLLGVRLFDKAGKESTVINHAETVIVALKLGVKVSLTHVVFAIGFHTTDFFYLATHRSVDDLSIDSLPVGEYEVTCVIRDFPFSPGVYSVRASISAGEVLTTIFYGENLLTFRVASGKVNRSELASEGFIQLHASWDNPRSIGHVT